MESASKEGWQYEYFNGSVLFCLREQSDPFNEEEDYTVRFSTGKLLYKQAMQIHQ